MKKSLKKLILFCIIFILIICSILLYSRFVGTKGLIVNEHRIDYNNLSDDFYGLKVVHISDIHYGRTIFNEELDELVKKINLTKPDIVIFTGDLIDKDNEEKTDKIASILSKIDVSIGKYAIKGEHDKKAFDTIMSESGFIVIEDNYELIYTNSTEYILLSGKNLTNTLEFITTNQIKPNYSILLLHEPDSVKDIDLTNFNLVLAGHSHLGQVRLPFIGGIINKDGSKKYKDDYYKIGSTEFYISGGLGVSDFNFRLFNKPSFNLYRLTK